MNWIELVLFTLVAVFGITLLIARLVGAPVDTAPLATADGKAPADSSVATEQAMQGHQRSLAYRLWAGLYDWAHSLFGVLLLVFVLRSFLFEPYRIPSGSMIPTLLVGDFVLVKKWAYGIRLPLIHKKIVDFGGPERGDIVVFRYPENPSTNYIKRMVGLPGDTVRLEGQRLLINGEAVPIIDANGPDYGTGANGYVAEEALGEGHLVMFNLQLAGAQEWTVPEGQYFVMGDNRDNSRDSRAWGFVPDENLVGKAQWIWMSWESGIRFDRMFTRLR
ncbi:signal peptidase I [Gammaproteobacteria bacterium]|nr:signal peptidase I [Gammaproteobacteria bacterium]